MQLLIGDIVVLVGWRWLRFCVKPTIYTTNWMLQLEIEHGASPNLEETFAESPYKTQLVKPVGNSLPKHIISYVNNVVKGL
jgi:hypothetical protein